MLTPERGQVTFDSEGNEGGKYHSRVLHVPTDVSGLTLGRGYDMRSKSQATISTQLITAGVDVENARTISSAAGLSGAAAKKFIVDNKLEKFEITEGTQKSLFELTYAGETAEARRICEKADVTSKYGTCDWDKLHPAIQDIVVDLKYRGDYTSSARAKIQKYISDNDLEAFAKVISDQTEWNNVPKDRFERRKTFIQAALAEKKRLDNQKPKPRPGPR